MHRKITGAQKGLNSVLIDRGRWVITVNKVCQVTVRGSSMDQTMDELIQSHLQTKSPSNITEIYQVNYSKCLEKYHWHKQHGAMCWTNI